MYFLNYLSPIHQPCWDLLSSVMTLDSCSLCCVLVSGIWFLVFDLCLCVDFPWPSVSFTFLLCSPLWLPLSVLFPSCFLMCSSPSLPHLASSLLSLPSPVHCLCFKSLLSPQDQDHTFNKSSAVCCKEVVSCRVVSLSEPLIPFHGVAGCCCWSQSQPWWGQGTPSRTLRHAAQHCPEQGFEPATFRSLVDLLYPLSYNCPMVKGYQKFTAVLYEMLYC